MGVLVLMLVVAIIRDYRARRNLPRNPEDKEIRRAMRKDTIYFFLRPFGGEKKKYEDYNPMKNKRKDNKYF
jgi:hypothetical protein